jgi:putative DNA primase/helicase
MLQSALKYAELGMAVIPLCPPKHQKMTASHRQECICPGKAPIVVNWQNRGVPGEDEIRSWFFRNEFINIGIVLGAISNIAGVDIDGTSGEDILEEVSDGDIPPTWEFTTSRGRRLLYKLPVGVETKKFKVSHTKEEEFALLVDGQQTVMPPSEHVSGIKYSWVEGRSPDDIPIADAPRWLLKSVIQGYSDDMVSSEEIYNEDSSDFDDDDIEELPEDIPSSASKTSKDKTNLSPPVTDDDWNKNVGTGERNSHVTKLAGSLIARSLPKEQIIMLLTAWNNKHCKPPLSEREIVTMVEHIYETEQMKRASGLSGSKKKSGIRPVPVAKRFLEEQNKKGIYWKYIVQVGKFYRYDDLKPPWIQMDTTYLHVEIRNLIIKINPAWDKMSNVNEVTNVLRELLADENNDNIFDIGYNPDLEYIYLDNGVLNWRTNELKAWDRTFYTTIKLPVQWTENYNPQLLEHWNKTLESWIPDLQARMFLQEFCGYCLVPDTSFRTAVLLYGVGSNGKSLFLDVTRPLFGNYMTSIPLHRLAERFETANLQDRLVNICGDIDAKYLNETGVLKSLITGDPIRGEYKHGKSFDFTPVVRLIFSANTLPKATDKTEGWYSRWQFIEFPNTFVVDPLFKRNLMNTMNTPEALTMLLHWSIEGLKRLSKQNKFTIGVAQTESARSYRMENDSAIGFVEEHLIQVPHIGQETMLTIGTTYQLYKEWCDENGLKATGQIEFSKRLKAYGVDRGPRIVKGVSSNYYLGLRFKESQMMAEYNIYDAIRVSNRRFG